MGEAGNHLTLRRFRERTRLQLAQQSLNDLGTRIGHGISPERAVAALANQIAPRVHPGIAKVNAAMSCGVPFPAAIAAERDLVNALRTFLPEQNGGHLVHVMVLVYETSDPDILVVCASHEVSYVRELVTANPACPVHAQVIAALMGS